MLKSRKGEYGYFNAEKKRRLLTTLALFVLPIGLYAIGLHIAGRKANILTVVAMVGFIPAALSLVGLIMIMMRKSIPKEEYDQIDSHIGSLTFAYELYLTSEKQNALVDCICICGNDVVGLVTDPKTDARFAQDHLTKMLRADGYKTHVHMFTSIDKFVERLDTMNEHADSLREGIAFTPDERYPGYDREDMIRQTALNVSL